MLIKPLARIGFKIKGRVIKKVVTDNDIKHGVRGERG